jgi:hypothetical protein
MRAWAALAACLVGLSAGCTGGPPPEKSAGWMDRLRRFSGPLGSDVLYMDVALLERPVGDDFLDRELWECTDEQVVALEGRARLDDNGFRVGQTGGILPARLQTLLTSERDCINPRHIEVRSGGSSAVSLGPPSPEAAFKVRLDGTDTLTTLEQAQFALAISPEGLPDGRVRLRFTPQATHGHAGKGTLPQLPGVPAAWSLQGQRPKEQFPSLEWDVTLGANEYVLVGTRCERPQTLGHVCFVTLPPARPAQRVLVVRTGRLSSSRQADAPATPGATPPLALQASQATLRGSAP